MDTNQVNCRNSEKNILEEVKEALRDIKLKSTNKSGIIYVAISDGKAKVSADIKSNYTK